MPLLLRALRRAHLVRGVLAFTPLLLVAAPSAAQSANTRLPLPFDPAVTVGTLPNGLRYYIHARPVPAHRAELRLAVDVGSVLEEPTELGVAHFVEHMAFNGSRHFAKLEIQHQLEAMGMQFGADLNAATTSDETTYRLTVPTDRADALPTGVRILADWAHGVTFDSAAVDAERGIILSEWRLRTRAGGSDYRLTTRYVHEVLQGSAYGDRLPIGDPQIIQHVSRAELARFYARWYRPQRMAVVVVGDVEPRTVVKLIERELGTIPVGPRTPETSRGFPERTVPPITAPAYVVAVDSSSTLPSAALVYRLPPRAQGREALRSQFLESMVTQIVGERADFLALGTVSTDRPARAVRTLALQSTVTSRNVRGTLAKLMAIPAQVLAHGFTDDEVGRARALLLTQYEHAFDGRATLPSAELADAYQSVFLGGGSVPSPDTLLAAAREHLTGLTAISRDEVDSAARAILGQPGRVTFVRVSPDVASLDARTVSALGDSVAHAPQPTYRDQFQSLPWIASLPPAGRVDSVRQIPGIDAAIWMLSNGARVVLKRTGLNPNQIVIQAVARGGLSLLPDSEYIDGRLGLSALSAGGFGAFSPAAMQRKLGLTGAQAGVTVNVWDFVANIFGGSSPRDAETLLQLMHLAFTAPRVDTAAITRFRSETRASLRNPSAQAQQEFAAIRFNNNPRGRPVTAAMVDSLDVNRAIHVYHEIFGDASTFTFYIAGAFNADSMRPLVERYIGSLPSTHAVKSWRDTGVRQIEGPRTVSIAQSDSGYTDVNIVLHAPMPIDSTTGLRLDALGGIAQRRLAQRLRTQLAGTYAVGISVQTVVVPVPHVEMVINFNADPARADSLADAAIGVLDSLAKFGPTESEVADLKALERRQLELQLRDDMYWVNTLARNGVDGFGYANGLVSPDPSVEGLDVEVLRAMAAQLLDTKKAIRVFFRPRAGKR